MTNDDIIAATMPAPKAGTPGVEPDIGNFHVCITPVGSRVTCKPAPTDTDQDWLVFVREEKFDALAQKLLGESWEVGGSLIPNDENHLSKHERFNSFTFGIDNLIVTCSEDFHMRFLAASSVAKRLNLLAKDDRIALFQAVLYGNSCDHLFTHYIPLELSADELSF